MHNLLPRSLLLLGILPSKVVNSNGANVTTVHELTDSTAASAYEGSKPVTGCERASAIGVTRREAVGATKA